MSELVAPPRTPAKAPAPARAAPRRRPSGAAPPLPHHLRTSGFGWLAAIVVVVAVTIVVFHGGLHGAAIPVTAADDRVVRWFADVHWPGSYRAARIVSDIGSWWTINIAIWMITGSLLVLRRWRHLLVTLVIAQVAQLVGQIVYEVTRQPRVFGVPLRGGWGGWSLPSVQMLAVAGLSVIALYSLVPEGRPRNVGKWVVAAIVVLTAIARMHLGIDAPTPIVVGVVLGVGFPLVAFRRFASNEAFPVTYRRGRSAHLDIGGARGEAIHRALHDQLGLDVTEIKPVGLSGSAGSTPLRLRSTNTPDEYLFGKLYSQTHLRSDRWYKLGRELLYGRLEDEKPFNTVRRLVQQEDYALRLVRDAGLPSATPYGFVELTPEREYLLVTEFFDGAVELGEATVDDALIDDGLRVIRLLWNGGLAHRDIKPANLMVRDGHIYVIDVAFAEVRPSPWRQAVDLANMMLCLALRSGAEQVYRRALLQFTVDEITEGFAAARGLALPSQLRRALRAEGRDLHGEFLRLLPQRPQPIKVQRWTPRRMLVWAALVFVLLLLTVNYYALFGNREASKTPLQVSGVGCSELEPLLLEAQSVPTAALVPCIAATPIGWSFGHAVVNGGRSELAMNHDRAGRGALLITLTRACDVGSTIEVAGDVDGARRFERTASSASVLDRTWFEVFPGGCVTARLQSKDDAAQVAVDVLDEARTVVGFSSRRALADALEDRSDGRLHLDR